MIKLNDEQITEIVVEDLKQSYITSLQFSHKDETAYADAQAIKRTLSYYMLPTDFNDWLYTLGETLHSSYYYNTERNK